MFCQDCYRRREWGLKEYEEPNGDI
jgi:hypothetical protein